MFVELAVKDHRKDINHNSKYVECVYIPERARGVRKTNWLPSVAQKINHKA